MKKFLLNQTITHWENALTLGRTHQWMRSEVWEIGGAICTDGPKARRCVLPLQFRRLKTAFTMRPSQSQCIHIVLVKWFGKQSPRYSPLQKNSPFANFQKICVAVTWVHCDRKPVRSENLTALWYWKPVRSENLTALWYQKYYSHWFFTIKIWPHWFFNIAVRSDFDSKKAVRSDYVLIKRYFHHRIC